MIRREIAGRLAVVCALLACSCQVLETRNSTGVLEYLYPEGAEARPPQDVRLSVPLRVAIAFVPGRERSYTVHSETGVTSTSSTGDHFSEQRRQALLTAIADAFRDEPAIGSVEVVPATYLQGSDGFADLDRLRSVFNTDLIALVSYDQVQVSEATAWSLTYLTVVGAFVIEGEANETATVLDTVIVDVPSRTVLFRAAGDSQVEGSSAAVDRATELRHASEEGFEQAAAVLIGQLQARLDEFSQQAAAGTVRGEGTPEISVQWPETPEGDKTWAAGSLGGLELGLVALLLALVPRRERRRPA